MNKSFNLPTHYHAVWLLAVAWPLYAADAPLPERELAAPEPVFFEQAEPPRPSENLLQPPAVEQAKAAATLSEADLRGNAARQWLQYGEMVFSRHQNALHQV